MVIVIGRHSHRIFNKYLLINITQYMLGLRLDIVAMRFECNLVVF